MGDWLHAVTIVFLAFGATARITRFINADDLAAPIRSGVVRRFGPQSKAATLIECPWCASIWVGAAVVPAAYWFGDRAWFQVPALWLTISYWYGWLAQREEPVAS